MANATIAQSVNRQSVAQALQQARTEAATSMAWLNALNRAALNLEAGFWQFDGETLVISSATHQGTRYTVDAHGCACKAGQAHKPCASSSPPAALQGGRARPAVARYLPHV